MLIAQFNQRVSETYRDTFLFYTNDSTLHRLGDEYYETRPETHERLLNNKDQANKNSFRLHFIME